MNNLFKLLTLMTLIFSSNLFAIYLKSGTKMYACSSYSEPVGTTQIFNRPYSNMYSITKEVDGHCVKTLTSASSDCSNSSPHNPTVSIYTSAVFYSDIKCFRDTTAHYGHRCTGTNQRLKNCIVTGYNYNDETKTLDDGYGNLRDFDYDETTKTATLTSSDGLTKEIFNSDDSQTIETLSDNTFDAIKTTKTYNSDGELQTDSSTQKTQINDNLSLIDTNTTDYSSEIIDGLNSGYQILEDSNGNWGDYFFSEDDTAIKAVKRTTNEDNSYQDVTYLQDKSSGDEFYRIDFFDESDNLTFTRDYEKDSQGELIPIDINNINKNSDSSNYDYTNFNNSINSNPTNSTFSTSSGETYYFGGDITVVNDPNGISDTCFLNDYDEDITYIENLTQAQCNSYKSFSDVKNVYYEIYNSCSDQYLCIIEKTPSYENLDSIINKDISIDFNDDVIDNSYTSQTEQTNNQNSNSDSEQYTFTTQEVPNDNANSNSLKNELKNLGDETKNNSLELSKNTKALQDLNSSFSGVGSSLSGISSFIETISDFISNPSSIGDSINIGLNEVSNKYTNIVDVSGVCPIIELISINYHGKQITFLSQQIVDSYFPMELLKIFVIFSFAFAGITSFFRSV